MTRFRASILAVAMLCTASSARADSAKAPPVLEGPKVSIQAYGRQNPHCLSWTDGCVLCSTDAAGTSQCSTPGIACQPHGLHCKVLRPQ